MSTQLPSLFIGPFQTETSTLNLDKNAPSNLTSFTSHHRLSPLVCLVLVAASTLRPLPNPTLVVGPRLATRDNLYASTYIGQLSSPAPTEC